MEKFGIDARLILDTNGETVSQRLSDHDSSLAQMTQKVLYMSKYQTLVGETTDDGRFTRMLADLKDGYILFLESNANYVLTSRKQFIKNNISIFGCGATITYNNTDATEILLFGNSSANVNQTGQSISASQNANTVTLSSVTGINVGDIFLGYNSTQNNGYNDGIYAEVTKIDITNNILTLSINAHKTFTITNYSTYTPIEGVMVRDLTVNCNASMKNIGINVLHAKNSQFLHLGGDGQQGRAGITLQGINCEVKFCTFHNFYDNALVDNRTGYGIDVAGHNINVMMNNLKDCKHEVTAGVRQYMSTNIVYDRNICWRNPSDTLKLQLLDMHGNVSGQIINNRLYNVSGNGIAIRDNDCIVEGNYLYSVTNTWNASAGINGILLYDNFTQHATIKNNRFYGLFNNIVTLTTGFDAPFKDIFIDGNVSDFGFITFAANSSSTSTTVSDITIKNNKLMGECTVIIYNKCGTGVLIEGNSIASSFNTWNVGININAATSSPVIIKNNSITHGTQGAECIRVYNDWNIILANILTMSDTTTNPINLQGKTNNIKSNNVWIKSDGTIQAA